METLWQDLRYGVRALFKSPGFAAVAILSIALAIGANTSIFSIINAVLLRPLPYENPDRLTQVFFEHEEPGKGLEIFELWSYPKFAVLRDSNEAFEQVAAVSDQKFPVTDTDSPERLNAEMVSASYFPMLGIKAVVGREFLPEEDETPGARPVAVIGHGLWARRFGSDPNIAGQVISLNKVPLTIVGVMPEGFRGQKGTAEIWVPMMMAPQLTFPRRLQSPFASWTEVIARLKPGVSFAQAQSEMGIVAAKIKEAIPMSPEMAARMPAESIRLIALKEAKLDPAISKSFLILFAAVGFVLLIACVNIANLLLARGVSRQKEVAVRMALGANRGRIIRQLLTESLLLALVGGAIGLLIALWGVEFLSAFKPATANRSSYVQALDFGKANIDAQVLAFNLLLSVVTGIIFGLLPALQASRPDLNESLKESAGMAGARHGSSRRGFARLAPRNLLVVAEIALALVPLTGAGLMIKSFARLQALPTGFEPDHLITLRLQLPKYKQDAAARFDEQLLGRIGNLPGVEAATVASSTPLSSNSSGTIMEIKDQPDAGMNGVGFHSIGPDYFKAFRIPLLAGRAFTDQDRAGSNRVVIINDAAARKFWPGQDPIGKQVWLGVGWERNEFGEVVGIVGDVKYGKVEESFQPQVYAPYLQPAEDASFVIARTANDPAQVVAAIRQEIIALDKDVPVYDIRTMQDRSADATSRARFNALMLGTFAGLALVLSAIGIYGVMSYAASGRTREIGIRMALGATSKNIIALMLRDGIVLTVAGLALGLVGAFAATRALASQLYGVEATDAGTFAVVALLLAAVALLASYVPARRATKVDPMVALRYE
ncbi:MAG TPA: ABC transporter permease [Blastocatellia bacterium]|nr:ABC transporter permease [Blastocatellia bacterium]